LPTVPLLLFTQMKRGSDIGPSLENMRCDRKVSPSSVPLPKQGASSLRCFQKGMRRRIVLLEENRASKLNQEGHQQCQTQMGVVECWMRRQYISVDQCTVIYHQSLTNRCKHVVHSRIAIRGSVCIYVKFQRFWQRFVLGVLLCVKSIKKRRCHEFCVVS
jgi:hypothetical protein